MINEEEMRDIVSFANKIGLKQEQLLQDPDLFARVVSLYQKCIE